MADDALLVWATDEGVMINGIAPAELPRSGRGVIAKEDITEGEQLIHVPSSCLLTADRTCGLPPELLELLVECSIHGQVAGRLCCLLAMAKAEPPIVGKAPWMAVLPRVEDFKHAMPLNWPAELQARLPEAAAKLLENQRMKHDRDLELVRVKFLPAMQRVFGGVHVDLTKLETLYSHAWLLVNTRCFFWDFETSSPLPKGRKISPGKPRQTPKRRVKDRNDCMALCPVIDCFNHFDKEDCIVSYDKSGFTVTATRGIDAGEEIHVSYGHHSNDFLLVEYGFTLDTSEADHTTLDKYILQRLSKQQQQMLEDEGFLGGYILEPRNGVCHRTQVALRLICLPLRKWQRFVRGVDDGEKDQPLVNGICGNILEDYGKDIRTTSLQLKSIDSEAADSLMRRWEQIGAIIESGIERMTSANE